MTQTTHVVWHPALVRRQRGCVLWFTGLSGSGKSTIANLVDEKLHALGAPSFVLDGDNVRHGLNASPAMLAGEYGPEFAQRFGLGFSAEDRQENIRRVGAVAELFCAAGLVALTAFVSPYRQDRQRVRAHVEKHGAPGDFVEILVDTPLRVCEARDPKGLYKKARAGEIQDFTGVNAPYEPPERPELVLAGGDKPASVLADEVLEYLRGLGKIDFAAKE